MIGNQNDSVNVTGSVMYFFRNCLGNIATSIEDIDNPFSQLLIYPNPVQNQLTISNLPVSFKGSVSVYNSTGQLIQSEQKNGSQVILQTGQLSSGLYFIHLKSEKGQMTTKKFIKK
jgi:hypothetical protein